MTTRPEVIEGLVQWIGVRACGRLDAGGELGAKPVESLPQSPQQASEGFQTEREFEERGAFRECALWRVEQGVEFVGADGVVREDEG